MITRTKADGDGEITLRWIRWGDADYLGARTLLLDGLLVQGAALANTAIEKYLKAVFSYSKVKIPHSHEVDKLYKKVLEIKATNLTLNESYLRLLRKAYKLRYPDDLPDGFNISLNQIKLLTQLDRSVHEITKRFLIDLGGKTVPMILDESLLKQDMRFLLKNVVADPQLAEGVFGTPSHCFEIRVHKGIFYQATYEVLHLADDLNFESQGIVPQSDLSVKVAHAPMRDSPG